MACRRTVLALWRVGQMLALALSTGCVPDVPYASGGTPDGGRAVDRDPALDRPTGHNGATPSTDPDGTEPSGANPPKHGTDQGGDTEEATDGMTGRAPEASAVPATPNATACNSEGALRCAQGGGRGIELCASGAWTATTPCTEGEVCIAADGDGQPSCIVVAEICKGSGGQAVCDGSGTMYQCSELGVAESSSPCASARHCQFGLEREECASCLPGNADEFSCDGAQLFRCNDMGDGYIPAKMCESESLCNALAGDCTSAACRPGQIVCEGDALMRCNADQTALEMVERCEPGLCDAESGACDVCVPEGASCRDERTSLVCNSDGSELTRVSCSATTPVCGGAGVCIECLNSSHCDSMGDAGECKKWECTARGCVAVADNSATCDGVCVAGSCEECVTVSDCQGNAGDCKRWECNSNRCAAVADNRASCDGVCIAGNCEECATASDCRGNAGECKRWECRGNRCAAMADSRGTCSGVCIAGSCEECERATDCGTPTNPCERYTCTSSNDCLLEPNDGAACTTRGARGSCSNRACEPLCRNGKRDMGEDCDVTAGDSPWECDPDTCEERTLYTQCNSRWDCGPGETCDGNVCTVESCSPPCEGGVPNRACPRSDCPTVDIIGVSARCQRHEEGGAATRCLVMCDNDDDCAPGLRCLGAFTVCGK